MPPHPHTHTRRDVPTMKVNDRSIPSPVTPAVTGIVYPSPIDAPTEIMDHGRYPRMPTLQPSTSQSRLNREAPSIDDSSETPPDKSLDELWGTIRQEKQRKLAKERPKVQSLEEVAYEQEQQQLHIEVPVEESQASPPRHTLTKQKSITSFRESTDGRSIVATFNMPRGVSKPNVHVSFRRDRLIVTWEIIEVSEWEEDGCLMRERLERMYHRTLPLPENTRFEEVYCSMNGRRLSLRYPNMRCLKVEGGGASQ